MDHQSQVPGLFSTPEYLLCDPATRTCPHATDLQLAPAADSSGRGQWSAWSGSPGSGKAPVLCHGNTQQHCMDIWESHGHITVPSTLFWSLCNNSPQWLGAALCSLVSHPCFQIFCRDDEACFTLIPSAKSPQLPSAHCNGKKGIAAHGCYDFWLIETLS